MRVSRCWVAAFLVLIFFRVGLAEDGYRLWLRYDKVPNAGRLAEYRGAVRSVLAEGKATGLQAARSELEKGLKGVLGQEVMGAGPEMEDGMLIVGTADSDWVSGLGWGEELKKLGPEGYVIRSAKMAGKSVTVIASAGDFGTMY